METSVCTLFEGNYHFGVGALVNSLCRTGFQGTVFAGYRGELPEWLAALGPSQNAAGHTLARVTDKVSLVFVPMAGTWHLTNLKAALMLRVLRELSPGTERIFCFDPDIVCLAPWSFFEGWVDEGVALVIDGNFPMPQNHPVRKAWRRYCEPHGLKFAGTAQDYYFNGGFLGITRRDIAFLEALQKIHELIEPEGILSLPMGLAGAPEYKRRRSYPFWLRDQDALNIAADLEGMNLSPMGWEAMGWRQPFEFMLHACGSPKPWATNILREAIRGKTPEALMNFTFLDHFSGPIPVMSAEEIRRRIWQVRIAGAIAPLCGALQWLKRSR